MQNRQDTFGTRWARARIAKCVGTCLIGLSLSTAAYASQVDYVDWTSATAGLPGSASGTMDGITVRYAGEVAWAQTDGTGINYWANSSPPPYNNSFYTAYNGVPNMPANSDIIVIYGQDNISAAIHNELTFSQPVKDPILLVLSMGQPSGYFVNYDFDQPFTVLSSGNGYWGGNSSGSITALSGDVLAGEEGHGAIQFNGEISKISWTASPYENWHGFTVGMPVTTTPEVTSTFGALIMGLISVGALKKIRG